MGNLKAMVIYFFVTIMGAIGTKATTSVPTEKGKAMAVAKKVGYFKPYTPNNRAKNLKWKRKGKKK